MRKTKIVCTLGPATDDENVLRELMLAGMNVGRINFSHGNYKDQADRINTFKRIRDELKLPIPLLLDTQGPEIRIGKFNDSQVILEKGQKFTLLNEDIPGDKTKVSITYKTLAEEIQPGRTILINDGTIELRVDEIQGKDIVCTVIQGGKLTNRKSINIPDFIVNLPGITEKDIDDIKYGIEAGFDYIAASFIRKPHDIEEIREVLKANGGEHVKIIAKIENREGVDNFDEILNVSDGIMVARGDLGVEIPMAEVPILQKQFIKKTIAQGKPVITATQMLESMITNPRPTRAEVSDVANAIFDESSAIMLSGETASGNYPVECVKTMSSIATEIEKTINYTRRFKFREYNLAEASNEFNMNYAVAITAMNIDAKAVFSYTNTGSTVRMVSSFGIKCPIYAITQNEVTYRQLGLCRNIIPKLYDQQDNINKLLEVGFNDLKNQGIFEKDDKIVVAGGTKVLTALNKSETQMNMVMGGIVVV